jgi:N-acetylglucosamine-6-phosphate deacetylase
VTEDGVTLEAAAAAASEMPARAIGRGNDLGCLEPGFAADGVLLSADLTVEGVFAAGRRLR